MFALKFLKRQAKLIFPKPTDYKQIHSKAKFKDGGEHATFNDLPIPQGSWQENYAQQNRRYTMVLLSGFASLVLSILFVATSGKMVFNFTIPDYPYDEKDSKADEQEIIKT